MAARALKVLGFANGKSGSILLLFVIFERFRDLPTRLAILMTEPVFECESFPNSLVVSCLTEG